MKSEFSTLDIVKALNIPRERLREWLNRGFVKPSIQEAQGQGTKALFSIGDIYIIELYKELLEGGFNRNGAYGITKKVSSEDFLKRNFVTIGAVPEYYDAQKKSTKRLVVPNPDEGIYNDETRKKLNEVVNEISEIEIRNTQSKRQLISLGRLMKEKLIQKFKDIIAAGSPRSYAGNYDFAIILNLEKVRKRVDAALVNLV